MCRVRLGITKMRILALLWITCSLINAVYSDNTKGEDLVLNFKPDEVMINSTTNLTSFTVSCSFSGQTFSDINSLKLTFVKDSSSLTIETNETGQIPLISKSGIFKNAEINDTDTLNAFMKGEPVLATYIENVPFSSHIGLYNCEVKAKTTAAGNASIFMKNVSALLPAFNPTFNMSCNSSNDCLLGLVDACKDSKCLCGEEHFYNGITCVSKQKFEGKCKKSYECSTWLSVCDDHVCTCRQGYFYDKAKDSCTNIELCPQDASYIFSRKDNVCYGVNMQCDNGNCSCPQNYTSLTFVDNMPKYMNERLWTYGFYSSSSAKLSEDQVMLLLSRTFNYSNAEEVNPTWYWPNGEKIIIKDIDDTEWSAGNTGCLYVLYDSCNSVIKASSPCPLKHVYQGCLIKLPKAYCKEDIDNRNTTWNFTEGGTVLNKTCPKGYEGNVTRECQNNGVFKAPLYNCTSVVFKNISNLLKNGNLTGPEALGNVSSEIKDNDGVYIGVLIQIQNILGEVVNRFDNENISVQTTEDFLETANFLLDDEKNGKEWKSRIDNEGKGAEDFLPQVENFAKQVAESLLKSNDASLNISQPNIVFQYATVDTNKTKVEDIVFPKDLQDDAEWNATKTLTLSLDVAAFLGQSVTAFTCLLFRNLSQSVPNTLRDRSNNATVDINSQVVSFQLLPEAPKVLQPELEIVFQGFKDMTSTEQHCSYLSKDSVGEGLWATKGCRKVFGNSTTVKCKCNHLTNFALLISPYKPPEKDASILGIITIVGCSVSGFFIFITLVAHIRYWRLMKSDKTTLITILCIMFLICYVFFLAGVTQTSNKTICTGIAVVLHYVFLVLFFLMLAEGMTVFITVTFPFHKKSHIKELLISAFVLPLILAVTTAAASKFDGYGNENNCWLTPDSWLFWMFAGPAAFIILANIITIVLFFRRLFGTKASHLKSLKEKAKMTSVAIGVLTPVMGLTWVFGFLSVNEETLWLQYVFCLFNSSQGVLIFLFHCVGNKQLRQAMKASKERKRTVEEFNSELKGKMKKKFANHPQTTTTTTTESNLSNTEDNTESNVDHSTTEIHNGSEDKLAAPGVNNYYSVQKSVQSELKEKLSEMFTDQNDNKSKSSEIATDNLTGSTARLSEDFTGLKTDNSDLTTTCLNPENATEKIDSKAIEKCDTNLIPETKLPVSQSSSDEGQCLFDTPFVDAINSVTNQDTVSRSVSKSSLEEGRNVLVKDEPLIQTLDDVRSKQEGESINTDDGQSDEMSVSNTNETGVPGENTTKTCPDNNLTSNIGTVSRSLTDNDYEVIDGDGDCDDDMFADKKSETTTDYEEVTECSTSSDMLHNENKDPKGCRKEFLEILAFDE
ncbi:adhesion G protein-coupled receptor L2-like isoform X2 [Ruditapes philippinarum]|nr:adhesion G protein-coupled receptor L2-like isoform X2 [Ruditapes philippinarum]